MPATRAAFWAAGSLLLLGLIGPVVGCGPNGTRKIMVGSSGGTGGEEMTGGTGGGTPTGGKMGTGGGTGGDGTGGGTGGALMPDAAPDVAVDMAPPPDLGPPDLAADVTPPPPDVMGAPCAMSMGPFVSNPFAMQTGMFTATFAATTTASPGDTVMGLSNGAQTAFTGLAVIVRFNPNGNIDARNGGAYAAASTIAYTANTTYSFRLVVNVTNHTYAAYVTPPGGAEQLVGMNYGFRTEQNSVPRLNSWTLQTDAPNTGKLCNFAVQ
jgi:hypothetical protein